jgi:ABC-2 type transport system permease protein
VAELTAAAERGRLRPYTALLGSRLRSQTTYRTSFALDLLANAGIGVSELATVYVVFANVDSLGGLGVWEAALVFALANLAFALADLAVGHLDRMPTYLRTGTLDAFLLRPVPVLAQIITSDVSLRRLGRAGIAVAVLAVALPQVDVAWTPARVAMLVVTPVAATAVFAALFVLAGALQFWLIEGSEFANAFTYGGSFAASYPTSVLGTGARWLFTYVVPAAFVAYLPVLALLDRPGPAGTPSWLGWCTPFVAVVAWGLALLAWRTAVRHYTGTGS